MKAPRRYRFPPRSLRPALVVAAALAASCGGGESGPTPLRFGIDDFHIAAVPVEAKGAVISTKQEYDVAQMERAKTQADLDDVRTKLQVARNEAASAELTRKSAETEKNAAVRTANLTDQNNAQRLLHNAELGKRAADAKVDWMVARAQHLAKVLRWRDYEILAREAKWQLEKARIAQQNNIRPAGFDEPNFERQYQERSDAAARKRSEADNDRQRVSDKERDWQQKQQQFDQVRGIPSTPAQGYVPSSPYYPSQPSQPSQPSGQ
jgi:hypothetical protein